jgi:hypothetical protein
VLINIKNKKETQIIVDELKKTYTKVSSYWDSNLIPQTIYFSHPRIKHPFRIRLTDIYDKSEQFRFEYRAVGIIEFDIEIIHNIINKQIENINKKEIDKNSKKFNKDIFRMYAKGKFNELENVVCKEPVGCSSMTFHFSVERPLDYYPYKYEDKFVAIVETSLRKYPTNVEFDDVKIIVRSSTLGKETRLKMKEFFELYPNFDEMFKLKEKEK